MRNIAFSLSLSMLTPACWAASGFLSNSGFDTWKDNRPEGWQTSGAVLPEQVSGGWRTMVCKFNSSKEDMVSVRFVVETGSVGSIWIDNIRSADLLIENSGFEKTDDDRAEGWRIDDWGKSAGPDLDKTEGSQSLRINHDNDTLRETRVWQDVPVKQNHAYSFEFDLLVGDDFQGEMRALVFSKDGRFCILDNFGEAFASQVVADRDRCGRFAARLTAAPGQPAAVSQSAEVPQYMNLRAAADFRRMSGEGKIRLVVEDSLTKEVIATANTATEEPGWQTLALAFQSKTDQVRVHLLVEDDGEFLVDNIDVTYPRVLPDLQKVTWKPTTANFSLPDTLNVSVTGEHGLPLQGGLELLKKDLAARGVEVDATANNRSQLTIRLGDSGLRQAHGRESYRLKVDQKGIVIEAATEAGGFYGLMTLLQLLSDAQSGDYVMAADVVDYPDMPLRGFHFNAPARYFEPEQAARLKMNTIMLSTGYPSDEQTRARLGEQLAECQKLNLTVIPMFNTLVSGYYVGLRNPNLIAGISVEDEPLVLNADTPSPLKNPYVIQTELSSPVVTSADGRKTYTVEKDYTIIDGDMRWPFEDTASATPFRLVRSTNSAIRDGENLMVSYDYVSPYRESVGRGGGPAYCPVEPEVQELMEGFVTNLAREFQFPIINLADDHAEFFIAGAQLDTDSRVKKTGKTPIQLQTEDVLRLDRAAKEGFGESRVLQWAGEVNEHSRGAATVLPKDVLINIWGYDASWPAVFGREAVEFWSEHGFETTVMPWDNIRNIRGWAQVVAEARGKGFKCMGMIGSCWDLRPGGFTETADVAWRVPKGGDKKFVELGDAN